MTLALRLKSVMEERNLSQGKLAKISGLSQSMIWKLINNQADGTTKLVQLAKALNVNPEWLQSGTGSMEPDNSSAEQSQTPVVYQGLFPVTLYEGEQPGNMIIMVPDLVKSDHCRAYRLLLKSGCAEAPAGTIIVVDTSETPGQDDLVYAGVGGVYSVYRYVVGGKKSFLAVDDQRVPLIEIGEGIDFTGVVVYLMRDLRN